MAEQWIAAHQAYDLAPDQFVLCARLHVGQVVAWAKLFQSNGVAKQHVLIPEWFWWAKGRGALEADWTVGDFSTLIDHKVRWSAFGVEFGLAGILEILPFEERAAVARKFSVASNADWVTAVDRGFDGEQLSQVRTMIDADDSDLFDVLNYIAHARHPLKRAERADTHRASILSGQDAKRQAFLDFMLAEYVAQGEAELGMDKLPDLLELKYGSPSDAVRELGSVAEIRDAFRGFQRRLYGADEGGDARI
jgi:hypothetical protein